MSMNSSNFFSQNDPKAVGGDKTGTQVTPGADKVQQHAEKVHVPTPSDNTTFGKGKSSPGSREYNDSNR